MPGVMAKILAGPRPLTGGLTSRIRRAHRALVRVTEMGRFPLLVGRDLEERRRLFGIVAKAAQWSICRRRARDWWWYFCRPAGAARIDAMTGTTQRIMAGDLSGRLPSDVTATDWIT